MKDLNVVFFVGRLTRDIELRYTPSGMASTKVSIAVNDSYKKDNQVIESVSFFDVNIWGNQAVNCERFLKKGSQIALTGRLKQNTWTDKEGQKRSKIEITADSMQFLTPIDKSNTNNYNNQTNNYPENQPEFNDPWVNV